MACLPVQGTSVWVSNTSLLCALARGLPRGPTVLYAWVAYTLINSTSANLSLQAACPCGSYSAADGAVCTPCPQGAVCGGALDIPRAASGFWRTIPSEWMQRGLHLPSIQPPVTDFVACPTAALCAGDQLCAPGSGGWMCTTCLEGYARGYSGTCSQCSREASIGLVAGVGTGVAVALLLSWWLRLPAAIEARCLARTRVYFKPRAEPLSAEEGAGTAGTSSAEAKPDTVPLSILLKQGLTFLQTFGALASFVSANRIRRVFADDLQLLPKFLIQLSFFADLGLSAAMFKCAWPLPSNSKVILSMFLPFIVAGVFCVLGAALALWARCCSVRTPGEKLAAPPVEAQPSSSLSPSLLPSSPSPPSPSKIDLIYMLMLVEFIVVPVSVSALARAQDCAAASVGGYLLDEPKTSCYDPAFVVYQRLGFAVAWVYIGVLLGTVLLLRGCCDRRRDCRPSLLRHTLLRFLTENYKQGFTERTWEAMAMIRKSLLLGLSTGLVGFTDGRTQMTAVLMLLSAALSLAIAFKPFTVDLNNDLDLLGLFANLAVAFSVSTRVSSAMSRGYGIKPTEQLIFDIVSLLLCLPFMLMWFFLLADTLLFDGYMGLALRKRARDSAAAAVAGATRRLRACCSLCACCRAAAAPAGEGKDGEAQGADGALHAADAEAAEAAEAAGAAEAAEAAGASGAPKDPGDAGAVGAAEAGGASEAPNDPDTPAAHERQGFAPTAAPLSQSHRGPGY